MEESPTIYNIPESCQIWTGIWTSFGRGLQSLARRSFWKIQPFIYYGIPISSTPPNFRSIRRFKLQEPSDEWINFRIRFLREYGSDPNSCFFMNVTLDNLFKGIFFSRIVYCSSTHAHKILSLLGGNLRHYLGVKPVRQYCSTAADLH